MENLDILLFFNDIPHQINDAVGISPFIVIPGNDLKETLLAFEIVLGRG